MEFFFSDKVLQSFNCLGDEKLAGVSEKRKKFIGSKSDFWKKLFTLKECEFKSFKSLFEKIDNLFSKSVEE